MGHLGLRADEAIYFPVALLNTAFGGTFTARLSREGRQPAWSPDSARIVYEDALNIFVMNIDGSGRVQLTNYGPMTLVGHPTRSPDGTQMAYSIGEFGEEGELHIMPRCGHFVNLERPVQFNKIIGDVVRRVAMPEHRHASD